MNNALHWYVIYTRSRFEKKVAEDLTEMRYEIYLPLIKTLRQWSDRKKKVDMPLFRSYVFIRTTYKKIKSLKFPLGAVKIISFESIPAVVPDQQIKNLKILLGTSENFEITEHRFTHGEPVEIISGALRGLQGMFIDYSGKKYVLIQIDALKQNIIVTINPIFVRKLNCEKIF